MPSKTSKRINAAAHYTAPIFYTADGKSVINRLDSHVSLAALRYLPEAISRINSRMRKYISEEIDFGKIIGGSIVVLTDEHDDICYAKRRGRKTLSRFVRGKQRVPSQYYTVNLLRRREIKDEAAYVLISAWIGRRVTELEDLNKLRQRRQRRRDVIMAEAQIRTFWSNHAFCLEYTPYWPNSLVERLPQE